MPQGVEYWFAHWLGKGEGFGMKFPLMLKGVEHKTQRRPIEIVFEGEIFIQSVTLELV